MHPTTVIMMVVVVATMSLLLVGQVQAKSVAKRVSKIEHFIWPRPTLKVARQETGQDGQLGMPGKRPFCNAFTGCGKKRTSSGPDSTDQMMRMSQKVIGEARLWELLQQRLNSRSDAVYEPMSEVSTFRRIPIACKVATPVKPSCHFWPAAIQFPFTRLSLCVKNSERSSK